MKKISKFVKNNYKFLIGVIVGLLLSATGVYAANTIYSSNVTYDNSNSGLEATNVQDALDETYAKCLPPPTATDKIINLYNDGSSINTVNIGGNESNPEVHLNATQGIMLDNNGDYRYYGADPNNYVTFNGETWRIIGVFNNVDDGTGNKETRLKIIRDESIGMYSWGEHDIKTGESDLMVALNVLYYNSKSGSCYTDKICDFTSIGLDQNSKNMIEFANYNIGVVGGSYTKYANDFYNAENELKWNCRIGIMNASDYMYATDLGLCHYSGANYGDDSGNTECTNNDWLFDDSYFQWTMTPNFASNDNDMHYVSFEGNVSDAIRSSESSYIIRPVLYLKSDVTIVGAEEQVPIHTY